MALEGGYNLVSLANSVLACVEVLLEDKPIAGSSEAYPFESTCLEQLNDVLLQENASSYDISSPLFDLVALTLLLTNSPSLWSSSYLKLAKE
ncbi:hypothetical protein AAG906_012839 [Vitis piasezkii]